MNINYKNAIIGAGILIIWGIIGALGGLMGTGPLSFIPPVAWLAAGMLPAWYWGQQYGVAGYVGTALILILWQGSAIMGGA